MSETATKTDNLKSVVELIAERPAIDNTETFERLKAIQNKLWAKITNRFPDLKMAEATRQFQPYQSLDDKRERRTCGLHERGNRMGGLQLGGQSENVFLQSAHYDLDERTHISAASRVCLRDVSGFLFAARLHSASRAVRFILNT